MKPRQFFVWALVYLGTMSFTMKPIFSLLTKRKLVFPIS